MNMTMTRFRSRNGKECRVIMMKKPKDKAAGESERFWHFQLTILKMTNLSIPFLWMMKVERKTVTKCQMEHSFANLHHCSQATPKV